MTSPFISDIFINNLASIYNSFISDTDFRKIRELFLDYIGVTLAGNRFNDEKIAILLDQLPSDGSSCIFGRNCKTSPAASALMNAMNSHVLELDDGNRIGMLHIGAPVFSALLAFADNIKADTFFKSAIIGYEAAIRLAMAVQPDAKLKGVHATGICGTVGAALAISFALNYDLYQIKSTLAAACTSASGLLEMIVDESELKIFNVGIAAQNAVISSFVGKAFFRSPHDPLGGKRGFLNLFSNNPKLKYLEVFNNSELMIHSVYLKPYAACRHCHPAIEAALNIKKTSNLKIDEIKNIVIDTYKLAIQGHDVRDIESIPASKMSTPFSVAVALITGEAGMNQFTREYIENAEVKALMNKITIVENTHFTALSPGQRIAEITINAGNEAISDKVIYPKGEPENPLSELDLINKFKDMAVYAGLEKEKINKIIELVLYKNFMIKEIQDLCR